MAVLRRAAPFPIMLVAFLFFVAYSFFGIVVCHRASNPHNGHLLGDRSSVEFRADNDFTPRERVVIADALEELARASGCAQLSVRYERIGWRESMTWYTDPWPTIYRANSRFSWKKYLADRLAGPGSYVGIAYTKSGDIFMFSGEGNLASFRVGVSHEVIHVLLKSGWHSSDRRSVMHSILNGSETLQAEEKARLRRALCPKGKR